MAKKNFQLTVILICVLYAQETFIIIINVKNVQEISLEQLFLQ